MYHTIEVINNIYLYIFHNHHAPLIACYKCWSFLAANKFENPETKISKISGTCKTWDIFSDCTWYNTRQDTNDTSTHSTHITIFIILNVHFWNYYVPSCAWTLLQLLRLDLFGLTFLCILSHNWYISLFEGRTIEQEKNSKPIITLQFPTWPTHIHSIPTHLPLIYCQGKIHATPHHSTLLNVSGGIFPCVSQKYLSMHSPFYLMLPWQDRDGRDIQE